jgi:hypothetical protein
MLCASSNALEWKSNILSSINSTGEFDLIFNSHNTLMVGGKLKLGPYLGYERLHSYVTDLAYGGALRLGDKSFMELQGGYLERQFRDYQTLTGKGYVINLLFGSSFTDTFGFTLLFSAKKIETGMDPRWIYKVLPYLGVTFAF